MKICVAQTRPVKGDIQSNIDGHKKLIGLAVAHAADIIIFPELSLTGYEPELAKELATTPDDSRLDDFQDISDQKGITIGVGIPTKDDPGILISMVIFQPHKPRQLYSKQYLHEDELPYFVHGQHQVFLSAGRNKIAPAICYELSVPEHSAYAAKNAANIYIASVTKSEKGLKKAFKTLSAIASQYAMIVLMSNCVGHCDNFESGGKTSVWDSKGMLAGQLDDASEGILLIDTETQELTEQIL